MCFFKTKGSKILNAKKDIVVYKIGEFADKATFIPYFMVNLIILPYNEETAKLIGTTKEWKE